MGSEQPGLTQPTNIQIHSQLSNVDRAFLKSFERMISNEASHVRISAAVPGVPPDVMVDAFGWMMRIVFARIACFLPLCIRKRLVILPRGELKMGTVSHS